MFLFSAGPPGFDYGLVGERGMISLVTKTNKGFQMIKMSDQMNHKAAVN